MGIEHAPASGIIAWYARLARLKTLAFPFRKTSAKNVSILKPPFLATGPQDTITFVESEPDTNGAPVKLKETTAPGAILPNEEGLT
jgi:hypothetical protein